MRLRIPRLSLALLLLATACERRDDESAATAKTDTIAGVPHVRNFGEVDQWQLEPVATIGAPDGPASFGQINGIIVDNDGLIYVADSKAAEIRVFDESGKHIRTMGRRGAGPSEFGSLYSIGWIGDTLAALDPGNGRIGLLSRTGEWLGQLRHDHITGPRLYFHQVGGALHWLSVRPGDGPQPQSVFVRYDRGRVDTLDIPPATPTPGTTIICRHPTGGGISFFSNPYASRPSPVPSPDGGLARVPSAAYAVVLLDAAGDTVRVIEKTWDKVPISDEEWSEVTAPYRDWMAKAPGAKCDPVEFDRPAAKNAIGGIFHDDQGRMWVEAVRSDGFVFDVFNRDGVRIASAPAPARQRELPPTVRGDRIYLVTADSLDVQSVGVYRIRK